MKSFRERVWQRKGGGRWSSKKAFTGVVKKKEDLQRIGKSNEENQRCMGHMNRERKYFKRRVLSIWDVVNQTSKRRRVKGPLGFSTWRKWCPFTWGDCWRRETRLKTEKAQRTVYKQSKSLSDCHNEAWKGT